MAFHPADSIVYGGLYGSDAMRAIFDERASLQRMLDVEAALARAQAKLGIVPAEAAAAITRAADAGTLDLAEIGARTRVTGYPVVALVRALSQAAGDAGGWTHWGGTTQDIVDTASVLQTRDALALVREELIAIARALAAQARRHRGTVMAGRTHLQHALPTVFGLKCATWLMPLLAHLDRIDQVRVRAEVVSFGGAVGTLASLGGDGIAVADELAAELGLRAPPAPWHVCRDGVADIVGLLGLVCGSLAKIATDIVLLTQTEVAEVFEPHAEGRGGSSTMPQKRNPIASEYILAAARVVQALVPVMQASLAQDHERGTGPWQAEPLAVGQAFVLTHGALLHARGVVEGLVVDPARMRRNLDASGGLPMAEAVMMGLAPTLGREAAHHAVAHACARAIEAGAPLADMLLAEPSLAPHLDRARIDRLLDPARYLGSADAFIDRVLAAAQQAFAGTATRVAAL